MLSSISGNKTNIKLSPNRYEEIDREVCAFFKRVKIKKFPIDCFDICNQLNIKVITYSQLEEINREMLLENAGQDGFHVLVEVSKGNYEKWIIYNDDMNCKRIRFTIMHEIGHIILDHKEYSELAEKEANHFAAYALAPPPLVHFFEIEDFSELAIVFDVSERFAFYAMNRYNNWFRFGSIRYLSYEEELIDLFKPFVMKVV